MRTRTLTYTEIVERVTEALARFIAEVFGFEPVVKVYRDSAEIILPYKSKKLLAKIVRFLRSRGFREVDPLDYDEVCYKYLVLGDVGICVGLQDSLGKMLGEEEPDPYIIVEVVEHNDEE